MTTQNTFPCADSCTQQDIDNFEKLCHYADNHYQFRPADFFATLKKASYDNPTPEECLDARNAGEEIFYGIKDKLRSSAKLEKLNQEERHSIIACLSFFPEDYKK